MSIDRKRRLLARHPILLNADPETLNNLAEAASFHEIPAGETALDAGDSVEAIGIVAYGRLEIQVEGQNESKPREVNRNESFGDVALITNAPSCCTVRAVTDSLVLTLDRDILVNEMVNNAAFNKMINAEVSNFVENERKRVEPATGRVISIGSAESRIGKSIFGLNLTAVLAEENPEDVCLVDFSGQPSGTLEGTVVTKPGPEIDWIEKHESEHPGDFPVYSILFPETISEGAIRSFLGTLNDRMHYVVVVLPSGYNDAIQNFLNASDAVYFLTTDTEDAVYETERLLEEVKSGFPEQKPNLEIVLNQSTTESLAHRRKIADQLGVSVRHQLPRIETDYLDTFETSTPYVLDEPDEPYSKTLRRAAHDAGGTSLGLALGSGAARGLAHIGVLEVLKAEGVVPDQIAGSSMGALIGAAYALGHSPEEMIDHARQFHESGGFFRVTDLSFPPNRSILRSTRIRTFLEDIFGDATFDDTEIPLRITVSELDQADVHVISEGSIVDAVMGSISLPMIFEQVKKGEFTFIDGGVLEPVPVGPLREDGMANVVGVNAIPPLGVLKEQQPERVKPREPRRDFHPLIKSVLPFGTHNLIDVGMLTIEAIEARLGESSTERADVVIDPYLAELSWFDFDQYERFIEQGRKSALQKLENVQSLRHT